MQPRAYEATKQVWQASRKRTVAAGEGPVGNNGLCKARAQVKDVSIGSLHHEFDALWRAVWS